MKHLIAVLLCLIVMSSYGQEMSKKEKRNQEAIARQEVNYELLKNKLWIMNSNELRDRSGSTYPMIPSTNFMMVEGEKTYVQFDFSTLTGWGGGVDNILFTGNITKYDLKDLDGKKTINLRLHSQGSIQGFLDILVRVNSDSYADVTINVDGERIQLYGTFNAPDNVNYYKSFFEN